LATRRRYKQRADHAPVVADVAAAAAPAPPVAAGPVAEGDGASPPSPLTLALQAQQHAEHLQHLQRQHATRAQAGLPEPQIGPTDRQAVDQHVDNMPGLSDHKKRFLKSHPSLLQQPYLQLMSHAYQLALHAGIPDDTPAMDAAVLSGVTRDLEHHRQLSQLTAASARPTAENAQMHDDATEAAAELQREAEMHFTQPAPMPTTPKPQRRNYPMTAPVSRDTPSVSGRRPQDNHLTAEEVQIAHVSFPHLPKDQAAYQYLLNKRKMHEMKARGEIQGDR
jgi:hypothetical protein